MKILVCVKQVPETESPILIDENGDWIQTDVIAGYKMNRLDEFAVEEAVLIKEVLHDTNIDVVSVGPDRSAEVIKRAIGMGADKGIHIVNTSEGYQSPFDIASCIAEYAHDKNYDLILTGTMSEDDMQGQVGPMIAACLTLPCATAVVHQQISSDKKFVSVEREIEGGNRDTLQLGLPAVLTIQSGINTPRYPSLSNLLRANQQALEKAQIDKLILPEFREEIAGMAYPEKTRAGMALIGTQQEKAIQLISILRERTLLK